MSALGAFFFAWSLGLSAGSGGDGPLWLTLEVDNPEVISGQRLLSLQDLIGVRRRTDLPRLAKFKAFLFFSVSSDECVDVGLCTQIAALTAEARARGLLVVGVILAGREQALAARPVVRAARHPFVITYDVHGLVRAAFGFEAPGDIVLMDDKGLNIGRYRVSKSEDAGRRARTLEQVGAGITAAMGPREGNRR